jgi:hypothetical protein
MVWPGTFQNNLSKYTLTPCSWQLSVYHILYLGCYSYCNWQPSESLIVYTTCNCVSWRNFPDLTFILGALTWIVHTWMLLYVIDSLLYTCKYTMVCCNVHLFHCKTVFTIWPGTVCWWRNISYIAVYLKILTYHYSCLLRCMYISQQMDIRSQGIQGIIMCSRSCLNWVHHCKFHSGFTFLKHVCDTCCIIAITPFKLLEWPPHTFW